MVTKTGEPGSENSRRQGNPSLDGLRGLSANSKFQQSDPKETLTV